MEVGAWVSRLPRLVLASQSARRRQLLRDHGLEHEAIHPGVDDGVLESGTAGASDWVAAMAYYKAAAGAGVVSRRAGPEQLVIGADTVCVVDGRVIGQPADASEAGRLLRLLDGRSHEVVTGVALLPVRRGVAETWDRTIFVDRAVVRWGGAGGELVGEDRIEAYVRSGEWRGKAGGYNLAERLGAGWPITFDGEASTIMGLPMRLLLEHLRRIAVGGDSERR